MSKLRIVLIYLAIALPTTLLMGLLAGWLLGGDWPRRVVLGASVGGALVLLSALRMHKK
jgi:hypothetical protein